MMTGILSALVLAGLPLPASAQQHGFPVDKLHWTISISGFDVQNKGLSLTVVRRTREELLGSGNPVAVIGAPG
jgi:hypothetical protein